MAGRDELDQAGGGAGCASSFCGGANIYWPPALPPPAVNPWRRPASWLALAAIRLYQRTLSRLWPNVCRYSPTCSAYAAHAIARRGILVGGALAVWRILRCNPFSSGGYDPPPGYVEAERAADAEFTENEQGRLDK